MGEVKKKEFRVTEPELMKYTKELLVWGKNRKLGPEDLCVLLRMSHEWLRSVLKMETLTFTESPDLVLQEEKKLIGVE